MADATDELVGLESVLAGRGPSEDDDSAQLEIDDFQTCEIRQIFLTTLPDYLEPVRQMTRQLFASSDGREEVFKALDTTLSSIAVAAARVEIRDVAAAVERVRSELRRIGQDDESLIRESIADGLEQIERIAAEANGPAQAPRPSAAGQTIVQALQDVPGFDPSVLERLTAAGLVSVAQLRMARPEEIVAVSGLQPSVVDALVTALVRDPQPQSLKGARSSAAPPAAGAPPLAAGTRADPLQQELSDKLSAQVDAEVKLDELRGEILQLRVNVAALHREVAAAEQDTAKLRGQLRQSHAEVADRLAALSQARAQRASLLRRQADQQSAVQRAESQRREIERDAAVAAETHQAMADSLSSLVCNVRRVLQIAASAEPSADPRLLPAEVRPRSANRRGDAG